MKKIFFFFAGIISLSVHAQTPEDALRYSFYPQGGSARSLAIGGAMGSLGGDISATYVNPAGLGLYHTSEFVFSPQVFMNHNQTDYRGTGNESNKNSFSFGPMGWVLGFADPSKPTVSRALSIVVSQTASFNNTVHYSGLNNYSSFAEQWAEQASQSGETINDILNDPQYAFGASPALYSYLVDTFTIGGINQFKALPEFLLQNGDALRQENIIRTTGGIYEIAIGYAVNHNNKWMFGGTIGIPILSYHNNSTFRESDTAANNNNNFGYFSYSDNYNVTGIGFNVKLGLIYKPSDNVRLGFAFHTPTFLGALKEERRTDLIAATENYNGKTEIGSDYFNNGLPGVAYYNLFTPLKMIASATYILGAKEEVTQQRGFLTADVEFVNHHGSSFSDANEVPSAYIDNYYHDLNQTIKNQYKGTFNFRAGGELKFNTLMGRLGFAYYANPYKDPALHAGSTIVSAGVGYRNKGYFVDLTYVHALNKDVNFPYRLGDKANTFAEVQDVRQSIVTTFGIKF